MSKKEFAIFKKLEEALRTELNSPTDIERAREKAYEILSYSPYRGRF